MIFRCLDPHCFLQDAAKTAHDFDVELFHFGTLGSPRNKVAFWGSHNKVRKALGVAEGLESKGFPK